VIPSSIGLPPQPRNDRLVALFLLGLVLFAPPLVRIFGIPATIFGIPLLFLYMFLAWAVVVVLIALDVERRGEPKRPMVNPLGPFLP
jgi:hypothetical protein